MDDGGGGGGGRWWMVVIGGEGWVADGGSERERKLKKIIIQCMWSPWYTCSLTVSDLCRLRTLAWALTQYQSKNPAGPTQHKQITVLAG